MRIDLNTTAQAAGLQGNQSAAKASPSIGRQSEAGSADSVAFSTASSQVTLLTGQALAAPEVRQQRVAELAAAVSGGTWAHLASDLASNPASAEQHDRYHDDDQDVHGGRLPADTGERPSSSATARPPPRLGSPAAAYFGSPWVARVFMGGHGWPSPIAILGAL